MALATLLSGRVSALRTAAVGLRITENPHALSMSPGGESDDEGTKDEDRDSFPCMLGPLLIAEGRGRFGWDTESAQRVAP